MFLSEMVRVVSVEESLVKDTSDDYGSGEHDWTDRKTETFTLSAAAKILVVWKSKHRDTGASSYGASRLLVDGEPVLGTGPIYADHGYSAEVTRWAIVELAIGAHTLKIQTTCNHHSGGTSIYHYVTEFHIGIIDFADTDLEEDDEGGSGVAIANNATETVISISATCPSDRNTPAGSLNEMSVIVLVDCRISSETGSVLKNSGDGDEASKMNWKLESDSTQVNWNEVDDDDIYDETDKSEGAYGRHTFIGSPGTSYTIDLKATNKMGAGKIVYAYMTVIMSPWIIGDEDVKPVSLDFPQGSTIYIMTEPLSLNPTKNIKIGKVRAYNLGDSTNYYSTASGTNILKHDFAFDEVIPDEVELMINGLGGCISSIGVDVR